MTIQDEINNSQSWLNRAQSRIPGGVNSPVRAFNGVGGIPRFMKYGKGPSIFDVDGRAYIDYVCSWGPLILGHAHPAIVEKVSAALTKGFSFGAPTEIEVELAEQVCDLMPAIEMIRFVSSGTEAAMSAIRLARGFTKRDKFIKFSGCYHGHADSLLVRAGSGALTTNVPSSAGVPAHISKHTLIADFNDLEAVTTLFAEHGDEIAAVILEAIPANMNLILPLPGFLSGLRELCDRYGALLIFDEVITGFRVCLGGAQAYYNIKPDLTILGKIIGGGFPAAAFGGRADIMHHVSPLGDVYQAGTLSGNPVAMTAGLATLEYLCRPDFYADLSEKTERLTRGLKQQAEVMHLPFQMMPIGGMFGYFFTEKKQIKNESDVKDCNMNLFKKFFHGMLNQGIYLAPSAFEVGFMSAVHGDSEIEKTIKAAKEVFAQLV